MTDAETAKPYYQGWADRRQAGTRYGPVHLFAVTGRKAVPLCGRRVLRWNFEGETEEDFCPRCLKIARRGVALELRSVSWTKESPATSGFYWVRAHRGTPVIAWFNHHCRGLGFCGSDVPLYEDPKLLGIADAGDRSFSDQDIEFWPERVDPPAS